jgi:hypothetical protein
MPTALIAFMLAAGSIGMGVFKTNEIYRQQQ